MLTSAVFLRAASFGIPTAQPPRTGFGRSFTAIARCGLLFQRKEVPSVTFADRIRQEKSLTPRVIPSLNNFAQTFHISAVCRPSCDWGSPCDCDECRDKSRERQPICDICDVNPTADEALAWSLDREGTSRYRNTSFCKECWAKKQEKIRVEEEAKDRIVAARKERVTKMLEHVKSLPPAEQVPLAYAVAKISKTVQGYSAASDAYKIARQFSNELQVVKVGNRWVCDKRRVLAMDFRLWWGQPGEALINPEDIRK